MRLAGVAALVMALFLPAHVHAAYPGQNGKIAYAVVGGLKTMNPDGTGQTQITTGHDLEPAWSPDGQRIAFVRQTPCPPCMYSIHVVNADGSGEAQLTSPVPNEVPSPTWSSDGQRIAFTIWSNFQNDIWVVNVDGSGLTQITDTPDIDEAYLTWSPDGTRIAYGPEGLYAVKPDGSDARALFTDDYFYWPDWSPDGQSMALITLYICDGDTCMDVVTRRLDGSGGTHVVGSDQDFTVGFGRPSWSPDGTRIVLAFDNSGSIFTINPNGTGFVDTGADGASPDWQPLPVETAGTHSPPQGRVAVPRAARAGRTDRARPPTAMHGPPLAFDSCNPPQPGSTYLTAGVGDGSPAFARSTGSVRMDVQRRRSGAARGLRRPACASASRT